MTTKTMTTEDPGAGRGPLPQRILAGNLSRADLHGEVQASRGVDVGRSARLIVGKGGAGWVERGCGWGCLQYRTHSNYWRWACRCSFSSVRYFSFRVLCGAEICGSRLPRCLTSWPIETRGHETVAIGGVYRSAVTDGFSEFPQSGGLNVRGREAAGVPGRRMGPGNV